MLHDTCKGGPVRTVQTSKSWVYVTPQHVYKLKKPIRDELQDLTSLRARHDNTLTEIDLNRRLAPDTYLGAVRVLEQADGTLALHGTGRTVDWLVHMRRLPDGRMLDRMIADGAVSQDALAAQITKLGQDLSLFYRDCPPTRLTAQELFSITLDQQTMNRAVLFDPLFAPYHDRFNAVLAPLGRLHEAAFVKFADRVADGWIRECHGDLRLEHVCLTDPSVIFDCLEFNRNLRLLDPFQEVVQLGLEADLSAATWIKPALIAALETGLGPKPAPILLAFYEVIHALLRTRLCLAHLFVPKPRMPEKWMPLGLRYFAVVERLLADHAP